jgi:signal transduction histidine kinase/DNA-binding response OmpR family regulator
LPPTARFYDSIDIGTRGVVILLGLDGIIRARTNRAEGAGVAAGPVGRSLASSPLLAAYAQNPAGTVVFPGVTDGISRIYAYRGVRGFDLIVAVGLAEDDVLAAYRRSRLFYPGLATVLSVLLVSITRLVVMRQAHLARARTELRASEAQFAQKSHLLGTTLDHMSQGILMVDGDRRVQVCNERALGQLDLPRALMAECPLFADVLRWQWNHQEFSADGAAIQDAWRQFLRDGGDCVQPDLYERVRPNGTVLEVRSTPIASGGFVRTYTDITRSKESEASLRAARDKADTALQAKSDFLATMSHEIRSPMSGLVGVLDLLRDTELDADQKRMAKMVHGSALALLAVLNDILDFSKIEAGALSIVPEPVCLRDLVGEIVQPFLFTASQKGIGLDLAFAARVPDYCAVDPLRLRQILNNLLSNAIKFTAGGAIEVSVDVVPGQLYLAVRDSGIGMSAEVIGRLFQPFMQADGSITRTYGGTGLGLCISRRLAGLHGGTLDAASRPGEGSVFTLLLPLVAADGPAAAVDAAIPTPQVGWTQGRVLVADDDSTNRWLAQRQLELLGLTVETADNGRNALDKLQAAPFDLLLTDCHMPLMDGAALTQAIRASANGRLRAIPVIGLTADVTPAQRERCQAAGMTEVATKPITRVRLAALLARHLPAAGTAAQPAASAGIAPALAFDDGMYRDIFPDGDPAGAAWLAEYLASAAGSEAELRRLFAAPGDLARRAVAEAAHRWAGASLSVGATRLGEAARVLERAAPCDEMLTLRAHHAAVQDEFTMAKQAISGFIVTMQAEVMS